MSEADLKVLPEPPSEVIPAAESIPDSQLVAKPSARSQIRQIEWGGYIVGDAFGSCSTHPMFRFLSMPPVGYRFTSNPRPPSANQARLLEQIILALDPQVSPLRTGIPFYDRAIREMHHVIGAAVHYGAKLHDARAFFAHRHPDHLLRNTQTSREADLVLLPTVPFGICAVPWLIEIEDNPTLFFPWLLNGASSTVDVETLPCYHVLRALLEADSCRGILTHSSSTAKSLPRLFQSPELERKVHYIPYGRIAPDISRKKPIVEGGPIHLLFTNSWHQAAGSFYVRGGLDLLEAFSQLADRFPQIHLTLRSRMPEFNPRHAALVRDHPRIRVLDEFMTDHQMHELMLNSDVFVLPAAHLHVASIVDAMGYAMPVVAADGWGIDEYLRDGVEGFIVPGRRGVVSWEDPVNGLLREDYSSMAHPDGANPTVVSGLIDRLSRLIDDVALRRRISGNARAAVETRLSLAQWNNGLKAALDTLPPPSAARPIVVQGSGYNPNDPATEDGALFRAHLGWLLTFHRGKRIVCYGAGTDLIGMLEQGAFHEHRVVGLLDDRRQPGSSLEGYRVVRPRDLPGLKPELIVITSSSYANVLRERAVGIVAALELEVPII